MEFNPRPSRLTRGAGCTGGNYDYGYEGDGLRDPSGAGVSWFPDENDSGGECGVMSAARFSMPGARKGDKPPFW
eukprot:1148336-Pelagomonas_calceolata.AAC.3